MPSAKRSRNEKDDDSSISDESDASSVSSSDSSTENESDGSTSEVEKVDTSKSQQSAKRNRVQSKADSTTDIAEYTVYVEGISYDANEDDVRKMFEPCGEIMSLRMPRYQDSGKIRGYAHIEFTNKESVTNAIKLHKHDLMGRYVTVRRAHLPSGSSSQGSSRPRPPSCRTIFVKNLPYDLTDETMKKVFEEFGEVTSVRLARWNHTNRLKGFGYVQFEKTKSVDKAMKKANAGTLTVQGRGITVDFDTGAPKRSFRNSDGRQWQKQEPRAVQALKRDAARRGRYESQQ